MLARIGGWLRGLCARLLALREPTRFDRELQEELRFHLDQQTDKNVRTGMTQADAEDRIQEYLKVAPVLSSIPVDTPAEEMVLRHGGYDVRGAAIDHNVVLPVDAMKTAETEGRIGELHPTAYSFVGVTSLLRLRESVAGEWADRFRDEGIEAFVMVPV